MTVMIELPWAVIGGFPWTIVYLSLLVRRSLPVDSGLPSMVMGFRPRMTVVVELPGAMVVLAELSGVTVVLSGVPRAVVHFSMMAPFGFRESPCVGVRFRPMVLARLSWAVMVAVVFSGLP